VDKNQDFPKIPVIKKLQMQEIDVIFGHLGYLKMDS
jgi:hypothetical protein